MKGFVGKAFDVKGNCQIKRPNTGEYYTFQSTAGINSLEVCSTMHDLHLSFSY